MTRFGRPLDESPAGRAVRFGGYAISLMSEGREDFAAAAARVAARSGREALALQAQRYRDARYYAEECGNDTALAMELGDSDLAYSWARLAFRSAAIAADIQ